MTYFRRYARVCGALGQTERVRRVADTLSPAKKDDALWYRDRASILAGANLWPDALRDYGRAALLGVTTDAPR